MLRSIPDLPWGLAEGEGGGEEGGVPSLDLPHPQEEDVPNLDLPHLQGEEGVLNLDLLHLVLF